MRNTPWKTKERIQKDDGRYLIFYDFDDEPVEDPVEDPDAEHRR